MANSIAEALGNFAQFIGQEQQRLEIEDQKDLMRASTQRITEAFSKVSPLATEEDIRQLMLDSISDAAGLGTLDTSMPLIQGFYNDSINAIKNYKGRKQDEALKQYAKREGFVSPSDDLTGEAQLGLMQYEQGQRKDLTVEEEQATYNVVIDLRTGKEVPGSRMEIGPGWKKKAETTAAITHRYQRDATPYRSYAGTTPEGMPISFNARNGQFFISDENGNMVPYTGQVVRGSQSQLRQAIEEQRLYKENKNSTYQKAGSIAVSIANEIGLTDEKGAQLTGAAAFNKFYGMTEEEFNKLGEGKGISRFQEFKDQVNEYDYYENKMKGAVDIIDYNDAKQIYNLTDTEFDAGYNTVIANINNPGKPKWMEFIRDKVQSAANASDIEISKWTEEDWLKQWHNLNNKTKASILNAIRNQNAQ